jgi:glycine C-acetyltransferase
MYSEYKNHLEQQLGDIEQQGLTKSERILQSAQGEKVQVDNATMLNLCANNYLGLAQHPDILAAAKAGLERWGYGLASVRFICGTQSIHKELENRLSDFLGMEDTILYPSCFDANGGLFETLLGEQDAVISDELNHASIIDGVRLCKARRYRYRNSDMADLEQQLIEADKNGARYKLITTDGVFSMDGYIARLDQICDLADRHNALVHFDDSHAVGFVGRRGRGTHELCDCMDRVDITTGTLGKALGGASGGYTSGHREIVALLRQRSRPYLFSNSVAPPMVTGANKALDLLTASTELRDRLESNTRFFRDGIQKIGLTVLEGVHAIVPVMLYEAHLATRYASLMLEKGVYVIPFSYPVVPKGKARIRTQISAAHSVTDLQMALDAFAEVKREIDA